MPFWLRSDHTGVVEEGATGEPEVLVRILPRGGTPPPSGWRYAKPSGDIVGPVGASKLPPRLSENLRP